MEGQTTATEEKSDQKMGTKRNRDAVEDDTPIESVPRRIVSVPNTVKRNPTRYIQQRTVAMMMSASSSQNSIKSIFNNSSSPSSSSSRCHVCQKYFSSLTKCEFCLEKVCQPCSSLCDECNGTYCRFCSTSNFEGKYDRTFCLTCDGKENLKRVSETTSTTQ
eukprot:TRINITY_DN6289_c0_g1_i2.p1 TRINITY_DN6289_c0_g1~~TRINITY_DN6289_c0_g1_i2.p1  ORF type:complete len:162 (-),score=13.56 TRINITY_DN6289_c0_g1_i2:107-592(-)